VKVEICTVFAAIEVLKNVYFQLSTKLSDYGGYWSVSSSMADGE
jgi:hypothetical protein